MRRLVSLLIAFSLALPSPSGAKSREEEILERAGAVAGRAAVERMVAGYLDKATATGAGAVANAGTSAAGGATAQTAGQAGIGVGGALVFAVQLGFAIDDFSKARTDKAKGFATANAIAAGVTLINPVAGLVVTAVIIVVQLIDAHQSAQFAKDMLETYARIAEDYKRINEMNTQMVDVEKTRFIETFQQLSDASSNLEIGRQFLIDNCSQAEKLTSMDKVDSCIKSIVQVYSQYRRLAELSSSLLNIPNRLIPVDNLFSAVKTSRGEMQTNLNEFNKTADQMESKVNQALEVYDDLVAQLIFNNATQQAVANKSIAFKQLCLSAAHKLTIQGVLALSPQFKNDSNPYGLKANLHEVKDQMDNFFYGQCPRVHSTDPELDRIYADAEKALISVYARFDRLGQQQ